MENTERLIYSDTPVILENNTNHFTVPSQFFTNNPSINYWKFQVQFILRKIVSLYYQNGSCSINSLNGTITTLFNISCSNWFDENEIKDYSFYLFIRMILFLFF